MYNKHTGNCRTYNLYKIYLFVQHYKCINYIFFFIFFVLHLFLKKKKLFFKINYTCSDYILSNSKPIHQQPLEIYFYKTQSTKPSIYTNVHCTVHQTSNEKRKSVKKNSKKIQKKFKTNTKNFESWYNIDLRVIATCRVQTKTIPRQLNQNTFSNTSLYFTSLNMYVTSYFLLSSHSFICLTLFTDDRFAVDDQICCGCTRYTVDVSECDKSIISKANLLTSEFSTVHVLNLSVC